MKNSKSKTSILIPIISTLILLVFFGDIIYNWESLKPVLSEEIFPLLTNALVLVPAILGLWKFTNKPVNNFIIGGFVLYALITIGGYVNVLFANDPLAAGLPMVMVVLPFAILFSGYLIFFYKINQDRTL